MTITHPKMVRVGRLELPASSSQRDSNLVLHVHENHLALSAPENLLSGALFSAVSTSSKGDCGQTCGRRKTLPHQFRCRSVFCCQLIRFHGAVLLHLQPSVYPGSAVRHKTYCGTSSRSNGSSPLQSDQSIRVPMLGHTLLRQYAGESPPCGEWRVCAVYDSNCDLCSIVITP